MADERKLFFVFIVPLARYNRRVIGAFLNALGILLGALSGLAGYGLLATRVQNQFKSALARLSHYVACNLSG